MNSREPRNCDAGSSIYRAKPGCHKATNEPVVSHRKVTAGSDRSFAFVFAAFFALVALFPLLSGRMPRWWAVAAAAAFAAIGIAAPRLLHPLNRLWFTFGLVLHRIVSPVIMAVMFFGVVLPTLLVRAFGKDLLRLKRDPAAKSYWIARDPPAPEPGSMSKQF
jgi:hypothetical protein